MIDHSGFHHHALSPFDRYLRPRFAGQPTQYLEIGVLAGDSAEWMMRHVLTHPMSWADLVDPWAAGEFVSGRRILRYTQTEMDNYYRSACERLDPYRMQCTIHRDTATQFFARVDTKYDIIYVDGNHTYDDVLCDSCHAIEHMKPGGILVLDDTDQGPVRRAVGKLCEMHESRLEPFYSSKWQKAFTVK